MTQKLISRAAAFAFLFGAVGSAWAQTLSESETVKLGYTLSGKLPTWSGGYLISIEHDGLPVQTIHTMDATGLEHTPILFTIPGSNTMRIEDTAVAGDGTFVICGQAYDQKGSGSGFVSWVSPDGKTLKTVRLFPYVAYHMAVDSDGTTWLQGQEVVNLEYTDPVINREHGVIRHFDRDGKEIGMYIPRSKIPGVKQGLVLGRMAASNGRIGWYADIAHVYYELSPDGAAVSYPGFAASNSKWNVKGLAITANGDAIASAEQNLGQGKRSKHMFRLDRSKRAWVELTLPAGTSITQPHLLGGDGNRLAMFAGASAVTFLRYSGK